MARELIRRGQLGCGGCVSDIATGGVVDLEHEADHDTGDEHGFPRWGHARLTAVGEPGDLGSSISEY
jgi:hypothetical protein